MKIWTLVIDTNNGRTSGTIHPSHHDACVRLGIELIDAKFIWAKNHFASQLAISPEAASSWMSAYLGNSLYWFTIDEHEAPWAVNREVAQVLGREEFAGCVTEIGANMSLSAEDDYNKGWNAGAGMAIRFLQRYIAGNGLFQLGTGKT